jgi:thioredoxin reductase
MEKFDVVIIGGGVSGLSCSLVLASADGKIENCDDKKILVLNYGASDAIRAELKNAAGIPCGTSGSDAIELTIVQTKSYPQISLIDGKVRTAKRINDGYELSYFDKEKKENISIQTENLVLASGFRAFNIEGLNLEVVQFPRSTNNTRVMIKNNDLKISKGLYVCGLLAGVSSQWSIAAGSGAQVAVHILSEWAGDWKVVHDKI